MEIIADYIQHVAGEREVMSWDCRDGKIYYNVPCVYVREVSREDYLAAHPDLPEPLEPARRFFWEVSVD